MARYIILLNLGRQKDIKCKTIRSFYWCPGKKVRLNLRIVSPGLHLFVRYFSKQILLSVFTPQCTILKIFYDMHGYKLKKSAPFPGSTLG